MKNTLTAKEFKAIRVRMRLSQSQLARAMGVHRPTITRWENESRSIPLMAERLLVCIANDVKPKRTSR